MEQNKIIDLKEFHKDNLINFGTVTTKRLTEALINQLKDSNNKKLIEISNNKEFWNLFINIATSEIAKSLNEYSIQFLIN